MHNLTSAIQQFERTSALVAASTIPSKHGPLERFHIICEREKIQVIEDFEMSVLGLYTNYRERDFIVLNRGMTQQEREFVAFHELGHYFHGHTQETDQSEFDANFFAFLSLRPQQEVK